MTRLAKRYAALHARSYKAFIHIRLPATTASSSLGDIIQEEAQQAMRSTTFFIQLRRLLLGATQLALRVLCPGTSACTRDMHGSNKRNRLRSPSNDTGNLHHDTQREIHRVGAPPTSAFTAPRQTTVTCAAETTGLACTCSLRLPHVTKGMNYHNRWRVTYVSCSPRRVRRFVATDQRSLVFPTTLLIASILTPLK